MALTHLSIRPEQAQQLFPFDTHAGIDDIELHSAGCFIEAGLQAHLSGLGKLDGIAEQIDKDLAQLDGIGFDVFRQLAHGDDIEIQSLGLGTTTQHVVHVIQAAGQGDGLGLQLHLPRVQLGEIQHIVDDTLQIASITNNGVDTGNPLLLGGVGFQQGFTEADDGGQRGTDFMAHGGQQHGLFHGHGGQLPVAALDITTDPIGDEQHDHEHQQETGHQYGQVS